MALEIAWGRVRAVIDEAEATLIRTAFSPLVREACDFGVLLLDGAAGSVAQSQRSMPSFVGTLPRTLQAGLERFRLRLGSQEMCLPRTTRGLVRDTCRT